MYPVLQFRRFGLRPRPRTAVDIEWESDDSYYLLGYPQEGEQVFGGPDQVPGIFRHGEDGETVTRHVTVKIDTGSDGGQSLVFDWEYGELFGSQPASVWTDTDGNGWVGYSGSGCDGIFKVV